MRQSYFYEVKRMGLSAKELMKIGLRSYKESTPVNWHGKIINVRQLLSVEEEFSLIRKILKYCCNENTDQFIPELIDLSMRLNIVSYYSDVELPVDIEEQHKLLYCSDLFDIIVSHTNKAQIDSIMRSIRLCVYGGGNGAWV